MTTVLKDFKIPFQSKLLTITKTKVKHPTDNEFKKNVYVDIRFFKRKYSILFFEQRKEDYVKYKNILSCHLFNYRINFIKK